MVILFAVLNKVAGVYGLIAVFTGGTLAQLSMYVYSVLGLLAYVLGYKAVAEEDPERTLATAHFFFVDHLLNTIWLALFAVNWWIYNPHNGARPVNSPAQQEITEVGPGHGLPMTEDERFAAAQLIWNNEKGTAALLLVTGWICKVAFALVIYSYAIHLRQGTYRSLPLTIANAQRTTAGDDPFTYQPVYENELDNLDGENGDIEEGYKPRRGPERDIDFDPELDAIERVNDVERARAYGHRAGNSISIGAYGDPSQRGNRTGQSKAIPNGTPRHNRVSSKPTGTAPPKALGTPKSSPPKDRTKSRVIQQQLERPGSPTKWDDGEEELQVKGISRSRSPMQIPPGGSLASRSPAFTPSATP